MNDEGHRDADHPLDPDSPTPDAESAEPAAREEAGAPPAEAGRSRLYERSASTPRGSDAGPPSSAQGSAEPAAAEGAAEGAPSPSWEPPPPATTPDELPDVETPPALEMGGHGAGEGTAQVPAGEQEPTPSAAARAADSSMPPAADAPSPPAATGLPEAPWTPTAPRASDSPSAPEPAQEASEPPSPAAGGGAGAIPPPAKRGSHRHPPSPPARRGRFAFLPRVADPRLRRLLKWGIPVAAALVLGAVFGVGVAAAIRMPRVETLSDFKPSLITQLYDAQGEPLASYARQRRVLVRPEDVPQVLRNAVVAVEDSRFYQHGGLDAVGVARAFVTNFREGRHAEGASTLTMQLARKLFLNPEKKWRRKIEESFLAVELEKRYSKEQILTLYLNIFFFGHNQYGIESAARYYFDKSVTDLDLVEAATLAGIPWRPSELSPYNNPERVIERRNLVLRRMRDQGYIDEQQYQQAVAAPLEVVEHRPKHQLGAYFAEEVRRYLETTYGTNQLLEGGLQVETTLDPRIQRSAEKAIREGLLRLDKEKGWTGPIDEVEGEDLEAANLDAWDGGGAIPGRWFQGLVLEANRNSALVKVDDEVYTLTREGIEWTGRRRPNQLLSRGDVAWFVLRRPGVEDEEEPAADDTAEGEGDADLPEPVLHLEQSPRFEGAALVLESATGAVRAMVGGWDFSRNQFNRATQARRQTGSAFKPLLYAAALESGFTPSDTLFDGPVYFPGAENRLTYSPSNYYEDTYYGIVTLREALERSMNVTAVKLLDLVGVDRVIELARRAGIESELPPYPSLALGAADLVPLELVAAYAAFANQGTYVEPYLVERVRTPQGRLLEQRVATTRTVTSPAVAFVLTRMLEGVVDRGTGRAMRDLDLDLAGKTGTTNDYTDAWFVGFTPRYTILVWTGYDQKRTMGRGMAGDRVAVPLWRAVIEDGLERGWLSTGERFVPPPGVSLVPVERYTGLRPGPGAEEIVEEAFIAGTEPVKEYTPEWSRILALPWYQQVPFYIPKEGERMPADFRGVEEELARMEAEGAGG